MALPLLLLSLSPSHVTPVAPNGVGAGHGFTPQASRAQAAATRAPRPVGFATYYARTFDGRTTASGTRFDSDAMVAAHPTYPFGTLVRVTNLRNGRSAKVRIVDRGPASGPRRKGVIIDLSRAAAEYLGFVRAGRARVRLDVLS
jgi:rare lipoprotein A